MQYDAFGRDMDVQDCPGTPIFSGDTVEFPITGRLEVQMVLVGNYMTDEFGLPHPSSPIDGNGPESISSDDPLEFLYFPFPCHVQSICQFQDCQFINCQFTN